MAYKKNPLYTVSEDSVIFLRHKFKIEDAARTPVIKTQIRIMSTNRFCQKYQVSLEISFFKYAWCLLIWPVLTFKKQQQI